MKFIFSSERSRILREKQKYVDSYHERADRYNSQKEAYTQAYTGYADAMRDYIITFLQDELAHFPGIDIKIKQEETRGLIPTYFIRMHYTSNKRREHGSDRRRRSYDYTRDIDSGYYDGFGWNLSIFLKEVDTTEGTTKEVSIIPRINSDILDSDDYEELQATYNLFKKIDTINWEEIINNINAGVPKREDYVTELSPGILHTEQFDSLLKAYDLDRIIGKDIWISVHINREESYDRWNSNNAGVDSDGWIRLIAATEKFYVFNWLAKRNASRFDLFTVDQVRRAKELTYKLKKIYITPSAPTEYVTSDDLIYEEVPEIPNSEVDEDEDF